jgi:hypothetical protein
MIKAAMLNAANLTKDFSNAKNVIGTVIVPMNAGNIRRANSDVPNAKLHTYTKILNRGGCISAFKMASFSLNGTKIMLTEYNSSIQKLFSVNDGKRKHKAKIIKIKAIKNG